MGTGHSSKPQHLLHFHRTHLNKLWVFQPKTETFSCFPVFKESGPFFFGNMETISVPPLNTIFVIGGSGFSEDPKHQRLDDYADRPIEVITHYLLPHHPKSDPKTPSKFAKNHKNSIFQIFKKINKKSKTVV